MRAEERVAAWTGVAWKDFTGFQVRDEWEHILNPSLSPSAIAAIPPCSPVHVDNHKAPARVSTSIIYLTTLDSGATVFPCILPEGTKKSVVKQRRKHCMDAAQRGEPCSPAPCHTITHHSHTAITVLSVSVAFFCETYMVSPFVELPQAPLRTTTILTATRTACSAWLARCATGLSPAWR
jgi:hypothetical protein